MTKRKYIEAYDWDRLDTILCERNESDVIYVYRLGADNHPVKPYLDKFEKSLYYNFDRVEISAYYDFLTWLRDTHGGGEYQLFIRRGRTMVFSGYIGIEGIGSYG